jgi:hypothetical protein
VLTPVPLTLRPATPADGEPLLDLVDGVVAWLVTRGRPGQWGARPLSGHAGFRDRTAAGIAAGLVTVAVRDGAVVGAILLDRVAPAYVPAGLVPPGALYVHTLVSDRGPAGVGAGRLLLHHAVTSAGAGPLGRQPRTGRALLAGRLRRGRIVRAGPTRRTLDRHRARTAGMTLRSAAAATPAPRP